MHKLASEYYPKRNLEYKSKGKKADKQINKQKEMKTQWPISSLKAS